VGFEEGPQLERVERRETRRWPVAAIGLGIALVILAVAYQATGTRHAPGSTSHPRQVAAEPTPVPSRSSYPSGLFPQCFPSTTWRVASLQQTPSLKVRTAWPVTTEPLPTPSDAQTPTVFGSGVEAIGFCTPGFDPLTRSQYVADVSLWRRTSTGTVVLVSGTKVLDAELASQGEVYLTPPASIGADGTWPPGDYYFEVSPRGEAPSATNSALTVATTRWIQMRLVDKTEANSAPRSARP
jgi:hypothetical protein